ncbi:unnamed protein product [Ranitomeya imitator]|uniref:Uncharacterized protein n=1 Tax=Ranitomeya imitator TaxID=111125 RepID=A0ABN9M6F6_9NEOB|nr:unnamed protein product [Ranitomeya imitator]
MPLKGIGLCKGCKEKPQRLANSKSIKFRAAPESTNAMTEKDDNEQIRVTDKRNLGCTVQMVSNGFGDQGDVGYPQAAAPTVWQEPPELPSGAEPIETTPSVPLSDVTGVPPDASEPDPTYEDPLGNGDGM